MDGVEKKTMESRSAFNTSPAASASTPSEHPMMVNRRSLRVMWGLYSCSSIEPEILQAFIELPQAFGVVGDGPPGVGERIFRLVAIAHHHIGTH
jgi:hypothetical protein